MDGGIKTPYRFVLNCFRDIFNEKMREIKDYYNYKKTIENGKK